MTSGLNPEQTTAVRAPLGPVLVRAGAGSGKTRVLTLRIVHLIEQHHTPSREIVAVTFTNKAATELRERLRAALGARSRGLTTGTFHSLGLRILRESIAGRLRPYTATFSVFGADEQLQLAAVALDSYTSRVPVIMEPPDVLRAISRLKSRLITPDLATRTASDGESSYVAALYTAYQRQLTRQNAIDFDDCILLPLRLFAADSDLREDYAERWRHILVDEYQDTDRAQYALLDALTRHDNGTPRSLFAVGDAQQAIYAFRNADHTIIAQFRQDFPEALIVDLNTNYRSRQEILDAAYAVIRHARSVQPLELRSHSTRRLASAALGIQATPDARTEADAIARHIAQMISDGRRPSEIAVLFRTGFMSRQFEQALRHTAVPYKVRGMDSFYDRAVIRDALAYLRVVANPADSLSLARIANTPARGITAATLEQVTLGGAALGLTPGEAILDQRAWSGLKQQALQALRSFALLLGRWRDRAASTYPPGHLLRDILDQSGYRRMVEQRVAMSDSGPSQTQRETGPSQQQSLWDMDEAPRFTAPTARTPARLPNKGRRDGRTRDDIELLQELEAAAEEHTSLAEFLGEVALMTNMPEDEDERDAVQLLTIHAAKGLEWPIVFVAGLEEGTLPHERSILDPTGIEEERRLCYVALTRAKEQLLLSWVAQRGKGKQSKRSRFLDEIEAYGRERKG